MKRDRTLRYGEIPVLTDGESAACAVLEAGLRPLLDTARMQDPVPRESSRVPQEIINAEEWRLLGERLRLLSPRLYEATFTAITALALGSDDDGQKIT